MVNDITEYGGCFLEGDAMLLAILPRLLIIPFKDKTHAAFSSFLLAFR